MMNAITLYKYCVNLLFIWLWKFTADYVINR